MFTDQIGEIAVLAGVGFEGRQILTQLGQNCFGATPRIFLSDRLFATFEALMPRLFALAYKSLFSVMLTVSFPRLEIVQRLAHGALVTDPCSLHGSTLSG